MTPAHGAMLVGTACVLSACFLSPASYDGRACDEEHACEGGRVCDEGRCVEMPCQVVASTQGADTSAGTIEAPLRSAQALVTALAPGRVGCLREGQYSGALTLSTPGLDGQQMTLRSYPGEKAELTGALLVSAPFWTVAGLSIVGTNAEGRPAVEVRAPNVVLRRNDITAHSSIGCVRWGEFPAASADDGTIEGNRIHHCGAGPQADGVLVSHGRAVHVVDNLVYANAAHGVVLYPATSGAIVERNVIDGNAKGLDLAGDQGIAPTGARVLHNAITFSSEVDLIESYPSGSPKGVDNLVFENCIFGGALAYETPVGFVMRDNLAGNPLYVDRLRFDYRLSAASPCVAWLQPK